MSWSVMGGKGFSTLSQNSKLKTQKSDFTAGCILMEPFLDRVREISRKC